MSSQNAKLLDQFKKDVSSLEIYARDLGLKDKEIKKIFQKAFSKLYLNNERRKYCIYYFVFFFCIFTYIILYIFVSVHTPTSSFILRNVQTLTYPTLKTVRKFSIPIIKLFPSLTDLYDETCLVENPWFFVPKMDCSPCHDIYSVLDLTNIDIQLDQVMERNQPIFVKTNKSEVTFYDLQDLYRNYTSELLYDSRRIGINHLNVHSITDLFSSNKENLSSDMHIQWRITKMLTARIIRKIFPKPDFFPERLTQTVERFLMLDGPKAEPYSLPATECSYMFLIQGSGERNIVLLRADECMDQCKTISIAMKPSSVLVYNWWYWKPLSFPVKGSTNLSISYLNSYC